MNIMLRALGGHWDVCPLPPHAEYSKINKAINKKQFAAPTYICMYEASYMPMMVFLVLFSIFLLLLSWLLFGVLLESLIKFVFFLHL